MLTVEADIYSHLLLIECMHKFANLPEEFWERKIELPTQLLLGVDTFVLRLTAV